MSSPYSLVNQPFAITWNETHRTQSQRKASLGDPQRYNTDANNAIVYAHDALVDGLGKIEGLVRDPTRTEVSKHNAARALAKPRCVGGFDLPGTGFAIQLRQFGAHVANGSQFRPMRPI